MRRGIDLKKSKKREGGRKGERKGEMEGKTLLELSKHDKEDCDYCGHKYSCCIQASCSDIDRI